MSVRLVAARIALVLVWALIAARLFQLQVIEGSHHRARADQNRLRVVRTLAPRGVIRDRNGRVLASSRLAFSIAIVPQEFAVEGTADPVGALAAVLDLPPRELQSYLAKQPRPGYEATPIYRDAPREVIARVEERSAYYRGVTVLADAVRSYPNGKLAAHLLGYVREVGEDDLVALKDRGYRSADLIGKAGIERVAEAALRGADGGRQLEVDARGQRVRTLGLAPPQPGQEVVLTVDLALQRAAEIGLAGRAGAVVALDPATGEVLALASSPSYNPNLFAGRLTPEEWRELTGPTHPQQNRAVSSAYPPGSLFKIITAAAALEAGQTHAAEWFHCDGAYRLGSWRLRCWKRAGHGDVHFTQGFAQSCNVMFATLGRRVGATKLAAMATRFGLGKASGLDLPQEVAGLVPSPTWKRTKRHQAWYPGDTCQLAVGQGDCLVTPLQMARMAAVIANGGRLIQPHLLLRKDETPRLAEIGLRPGTLDAIRAGMKAVVAAGGTAHGITSERYAIAGKTGTAQATGGRPHAWFAGFAPADNPTIAVAVIVEHGGNGSETAAPIARRVFDTWVLAADRVRKAEPQ